MSSTLWADLVSLIETLEEIQDDLEIVLKEKGSVLRDARGDDLLRLAQREGALAQRLQAFAASRSQLLAQARRQGLPADSLLVLSGAIGGPQGAAVQARAERASGRAALLRRQSWTHWILAHRSYHHYTALLEMIAHGGKGPPTYSDSPAPQSGGRGGVVLDASV